MTGFIVNHLWQSTCFALLAGVVAFLLRGHSPKVRYWVWLSASLKFLAPWVLLVNLGSVIPWPGGRAAVVATAVVPDAVVRIAEPFSPELPNPYATVVAQPPLDWGVAALALVWAAGFLVIVFRRGRSWLAVRALLRAGTPVKLPVGVPALVIPGVTEPGVVGFLRPVLILPALLLERLSPRQMEALLAHELSHVRRRDNLFAALHMGVEAIFWFHPLVWWIGSRLLEERELACDEEVLRAGCEPADYVRGILTVCQHYSETLLPCVAGVTGADVKKRLKAILRGDLARELTGHKKLALACAAMAAVAAPVGLGVWMAPVLHAQSEAPRFEVTSVKPRVPGSGIDLTECSGDRYSMSGPVFWNILEWAFDLHGEARSKLFLDRVPESISRKSYEIKGKAAAPMSESTCRLMVQGLLVDRFKLAFHYEMIEADVYDLVVAPGGPKLEKVQPTDEGSDVHVMINGKLVYWEAPIADPEERKRTKGWSMDDLAIHVPTLSPQPVTDKTGLEGRYKMDLRYSTVPLAVDDQDLVDPPFEVAIAKLGLRLEKHKGSVKVPVLDHIEPPDPN